MVLVTPVTAHDAGHPAGSLTGTVTATVPVTQPLVTEVRVTQTITCRPGHPAADRRGPGGQRLSLHRPAHRFHRSAQRHGVGCNLERPERPGSRADRGPGVGGYRRQLPARAVPRRAQHSPARVERRSWHAGFWRRPLLGGAHGQAYIRGVHQGSAGKVAAVGKPLAGPGASDRSLDEEVATVDRSLDALRLIELQPFFAVTRLEPVTDTVDALMTAHIRYRVSRATSATSRAPSASTPRHAADHGPGRVCTLATGRRPIGQRLAGRSGHPALLTRPSSIPSPTARSPSRRSRPETTC